MATRIYKTPFAATGDKEPLATDDQPDGKVSLQAGWTPDYELPNDSANYRPVGRQEMNGILSEITEGLGEMQLSGFAKWLLIEGGWPMDAIVVHDGVVYISASANNTDTPGEPGGSWRELFNFPGTGSTPTNWNQVALLESPTFTGTPKVPTATPGTNNEQAASTAFVAAAVASADPNFVGAVLPFAMSTAPAGWLKANGAAVSVAAYPALATKIYVGDANNATALFGYRCTDPESPSTTRSITGPYIVLPDMRGEFVRGWSDGRDVDTGRVFGSFQPDALKSHTHNYATYSSTASNVGAFGGSGASVQQGITLATGDTETRGRNIAILFCIKY